LERINVGGMAEVFKAKAFGVEGFERIVAVKRILPNIAEDKEFITMFVDEAKIAVQLNHANIAQIFDLGKVDDSYFIALEYVHGKDLRAIFDHCRQSSESMPVAQACFITMKVCEGLDYAHNKRDATGRELGLVHRDISPQNVLLSYEGEIKIIDFGIAKAAGKASKTQAGILKGKFGYMSPEQVRGMPLDRRSDIFSLGIVLYELLTGERLFVGESDFSTLEKVRNVEILPPSTYNRRIPEELERIVLRALAKDVEDRYQNAIDLHDELQAFMYSAGEFYSRKDLAAWMKSVWAKDIEEETRKLKEYQSVSAPAAPRGAAAPPPIPDNAPVPPADPSPFGDEQPFAANPGEPDYADPFDPAGPDLDWDDEEIETQLYDRDEQAEAEIDRRLRGGGPVAAQPEPEPPLPEFNRPPKPSGQRRTLMGMGAVSPEPAEEPAAEPVSPQPAPAQEIVPQPAVPDPAPSPQQPVETFGLGVAEDAAPPLEPAPSFDAQPRAKSSKGLIIGIVALAVVLLGGGGTALWFLVLKPAEKGTVVLKAPEIEGLKVYVDGQPVNIAPGVPLTMRLETDSDFKHLIHAEAPGYKTFEKSFVLEGGGKKVFELELEPVAGEEAKGNGTLKVTTTPPGAIVYLDDQQIKPNRTPLQVLDLAAGEHKIRIEMPNYLNWPAEGTKTITIKPDEVKTVKATLQPKVVMLIVKSEAKGAKVTLLRNGKPVVKNKSAPLTHKLTPESGASYEVVVDARGYDKFKKTLELEGQPELVVNAELERTYASRGYTRPTRTTRTTSSSGGRTMKPHRDPPMRRDPPVMRPKPMRPSGGGGTGTLRINTKPWTKIYVDGSYKGNTPKTNLKIPAGRHRLRLVNKEFGISKSYTITIKPGRTKTFVRKFKRN
jgi:serine/threonine protein kinase